MRKALGLAVLVGLGVLGWLYWQQHKPQALVVSGFVEADLIRVGSRVGGRVAEVSVVEGQQVKAGTPLFRIDPFDLQEQLKQAEAELAASQADHARLKAGNRPQEIEQARAKFNRMTAIHEKLVAGPRPREIEIAREELNRAKAGLELAESEHERVESLRKQGTAPKIELDLAIRQLKAAKADTAAAQLKLALLEEGSRKEDLAEAKAALAEAEQAMRLLEAGFRTEDLAKAAAQVMAAQARVAAIQVRLRELVVIAPCDCSVEAIDLHPGDLVAMNAPAVSLLDKTSLWVRAYLPESRLGQVQLGQKVPIRVDSFPTEQFQGRLTFLAQEAEFTPRNVQTPEERSKQVFRIKVYLDQGLDRLRVGMAADVLLGEAANP
ncbi:MAG TPA: efflux RND transporter periplasmic adaptor subunit [Phycisphaerae bacterium]|nr:efflux RND transporter periplasmic adaptor subunit [Phycisphaerae bacterium]HRY68006.1 efflux RND transporter periplasmic adaptor subunit [Phycisphaerae bacterium]HSA26743.1 efflux RND transporter periplasmic adaptor subunit [Phycisphaerae bacterium]